MPTARSHLRWKRSRVLRKVASLLHQAGWEGFAIGPDCSVFEVFLLPDGHGLFERIDQPTASFESLGPMCGGYRNQDTGLAHFQPSQAMHHSYLADAMQADRLFGQGLHLAQGHLRVRFVDQKKGAPSPSVVADDAIENHHGAVFPLLDTG